MMARVRFLAALLALFAFSASLAEEAWASTCAEPPEAAQDAGGADDHAGMPGHGMPVGGDDQVPSEPPGPADCPLMAVSAGCVVVSLPAEVERPGSPPPATGGGVLALSDRIPDLLIGSSLFRPPQA